MIDATAIAVPNLENSGTDEYLRHEYGYPPNWLDTLDNLRTVGDQLPGIVVRSDDDGLEVSLKILKNRH